MKKKKKNVAKGNNIADARQFRPYKVPYAEIMFWLPYIWVGTRWWEETGQSESKRESTGIDEETRIKWVPSCHDAYTYYSKLAPSDHSISDVVDGRRMYGLQKEGRAAGERLCSYARKKIRNDKPKHEIRNSLTNYSCIEKTAPVLLFWPHIPWSMPFKNQYHIPTLIFIIENFIIANSYQLNIIMYGKIHTYG